MTLYPGTSLFPATTAPFPEAGGESVPTVVTGGAIATGPVTASLAGSIDPHDLQTRYFFEYGFTVAYGSNGVITLAGIAPINVIQGITVTDGAATYHYRLVAWNAAGTAYGLDRTFTGFYGPADLSFIHESGKGQY